MEQHTTCADAQTTVLNYSKLARECENRVRGLVRRADAVAARKPHTTFINLHQEHRQAPVPIKLTT